VNRTKALRDVLDRRLDGAAAERALAALPERDHEEARRLLALARAARALPRTTPREGFVDEVMNRVAAATPPRRRTPSFSPWLTQIGVASAAAAFLALAVARYPGPAPDRAGAPPEPPRAHLVLAAPSAREVRVAGDFNAWRPEATPLRRAADGSWQVDVTVERGRRYQYMFVVDGTWVPDPAAPRLADDGFGGQNAILDT
jgi:hypothetical protein